MALTFGEEGDWQLSNFGKRKPHQFPAARLGSASTALGSRAVAASHISRGSKVSAANIVRITTAQKASAPAPG
jgi:hypothetical protein